MTTKAHSTLTGSDLHEPKGAASATSGQVYVANGAGSGVWTTPAATPAAPGLLLLSTQTASSSSQIDFVTGTGGVLFDGTYHMFELRISSLKVSADNTDVRIRVGTGGTPTYQTTGYVGGCYSEEITTANSGGSAQTSNTSGIPLTTQAAAANNGVTNASGRTFDSVIRFNDPNLTNYTMFRVDSTWVSSVPSIFTGRALGMWNTAGAVTAVRIYPSGGSFVSGTLALYAYAKA